MQYAVSVQFQNVQRKNTLLTWIKCGLIVVGSLLPTPLRAPVNTDAPSVPIPLTRSVAIYLFAGKCLRDCVSDVFGVWRPAQITVVNEVLICLPIFHVQGLYVNGEFVRASNIISEVSSIIMPHTGDERTLTVEGRSSLTMAFSELRKSLAAFEDV